MNAQITAVSYCVPGEGALLPDLLAERPRVEGRFRECPPPVRPDAVPAGSWRRMSRLDRIVAQVATPLALGYRGTDQLAIVWGTVYGELGPTGRFLDKLFEDGVASPLAFQNSVYNAPVGHLTNALDLGGPSETMSAGGATGLLALQRGIDLLALDRAPAVLVVVGDVLCDGVRRSWDLLDVREDAGEAVAAVLLRRDGDGPTVEVELGPARGAPCFARGAALPDEPAAPEVPVGAHRPEVSLGLVPSMGLAVLAALAECNRSGTVSEQDGSTRLFARVEHRR